MPQCTICLAWRRNKVRHDECAWNWPRSFVALDREVPRWDQPLLSDFHAVDVVMVCQRRGGVLHFLLLHAVEIGFRDAFNSARACN